MVIGHILFCRNRMNRDIRTYTIVRNMLISGIADADIIAIAECGLDLVDTVRTTL